MMLIDHHLIIGTDSSTCTEEFTAEQIKTLCSLGLIFETEVVDHGTLCNTAGTPIARLRTLVYRKA